jgi:hypothetical protein
MYSDWQAQREDFHEEIYDSSCDGIWDLRNGNGRGLQGLCSGYGLLHQARNEG